MEGRKESTNTSPGSLLLVLRRWKIGKARCEHGLSVRLSACLPGISDVTVQRRCEGKGGMAGERSYRSNTGKKRGWVVNESDGLHAAIHWHSSTKGQIAHCIAQSTTCAVYISGRLNDNPIWTAMRIRVFPIEEFPTRYYGQCEVYINLACSPILFLDNLYFLDYLYLYLYYLYLFINKRKE